MKKRFFLLVFQFSHFLIFSQVLNCTATLNYGNNPEHGHYVMVNGINMYYETYGDPTKQPLLLIHGNGGSVKAGGCQIEYFKDDYFVIITDSRYHGKSDNGSQELTYRLMASDYKALLDHLKLDSVNIIGQSDGAVIGLLLAIEYPTKVNKLVASAPNLRPDTTVFYQWGLDEMTKELAKVEAEMEEGNTSSELVRQEARLNLMLKHPHISTEELKKIEAPVLLVFGDEDYMKYEHVIEIYQNLPKANLWIVPSAGHRTYRLEPELFNMFCKRFFDNPFKKPLAREGY